MTDDPTPLDAQEKVAEIRDTFDYYSEEFQPIRDEGDEDMRYVAADPWTEKDKRLREEAMRPIQVADELHQFFNQVINDAKLNPRSAKFSPTGYGTNDARADIYNDKWRETDYRSKATRHFITALENCIYRSYGWVRVARRHESMRSRNQELWVEGLPNPNLIIPDPHAMETDSSDMEGLFAAHLIDRAEFRRRWPDAQEQDFGPEIQKLYSGWVKDDKRIQIAEWWEVEKITKKLMVIQREAALRVVKPEILGDPTHEIHQHLRLDHNAPVGVFLNELDAAPSQDAIIESREVTDRKVKQYLTNGIELLEKPIEWPGKYIPFASCYGKIIYLDQGGRVSKQILSMTRLARNPYMALCYLATVKLELIGMMPKFPYFAPKGSIDQANKLLLQKSLHEPVALVEYEDFDSDRPGIQRAPPSRQPYEPPLGPIEIAYESTRRSIQAAMGITPLPTPAQRNNEKTGAALQKIEDSGQKGSFHYFDAYDGMVCQTATIWEDLFTPVYDTMREIGVRDAMGAASRIIINDPSKPDTSTKGTYLVTVSSAPAEASSRDASKGFISSLLQSQNLQFLGPDMIKKLVALGLRIQNAGPVAELVADMIDPPQGKQSPELLAQQATQMQGQLQQVTQAYQKLLQDMNAEVVKTKGMLIGKQMEQVTELRIKKMDDDTKILVALIGAQAKAALSEQEAIAEATRLGVQVVHEERMADKEDRTESGTQGRQHAHEIHTLIRDHVHQMAQTAHEHRNTIDQLVAGAALQPSPDAAPATGV